jgi:hypothetical protein
MENFVHKRDDKKHLEEMLSSYFNQPISLVETTNDLDEDYQFSFDIEDEELGEISFDIWYLKTRKEERMYITEVGYDFVGYSSYLGW